MKQLKYFLFIIILSGIILPGMVQAQVSLPLRLVTSTGTPQTGEAADIDFTRYPHSYPGNIVSGITVTETGTAGNYRCTGFSTWEYVKLWVDGVEQTWFDSVQVGNIKDSYLIPNYPRLSISNTFTGSTNTFESGYFNGSVTVDGPAFTAVDPYINDAGDPYLLYQSSQNSLVHVRLADSLYGRRFWYNVGDTAYRMHTGKFIYGRTNSTAPFKLNTAQFSWTNDKLNLSSTVLHADSIKHNIITSGKDTTWTVLGEPVTKWRFFSLKKGFWANESYTIPPWKWVYESYNESGVLQSTDSMMAVNDVLEVDNATSVSAGYDATYILVDSLTLQPGKYFVDFGIMWERPNHNNILQVGISDTVEVALKEEGSAPNTYIKRHIYSIHTYTATVNFEGGTLDWSGIYTGLSNNKKIYLYARYYGTALSNALSVGTTVTVTRGRVVASLIR